MAYQDASPDSKDGFCRAFVQRFDRVELANCADESMARALRKGIWRSSDMRSIESIMEGSYVQLLSPVVSFGVKYMYS